jgi:hypothetical protein
MLPTLLHLSVYLFLAGLVITFHTIHKKVAIAVNDAVGVSGLVYLALSILPCLDVRCPYRTPISQILWYPCHAFLSFAAPFLDRCILGLRELLNQPVQSSGLFFSHHWQYFTYGLEKSIVDRAIETLKDGDRGRVTRLFNQLALGSESRTVFGCDGALCIIWPLRVTVTHIERSRACNLNNTYNSLCRASSTSSSLKAPPRLFLKQGLSCWSGDTRLQSTGLQGTSHFLPTFGFADAL